MKSRNIVFAMATVLATVAGVATAEEKPGQVVQSSRHWWQPDPDSFYFQIQKDNEKLKQQGFDPYAA